MKILQVNTIDNLGGAARLAWQMFQGYQQLGYETSFAVAAKHSHDPNVLNIAEALPSHDWFRFCDFLRASLQAWNGKGLGAGRVQVLLSKVSRPLHFLAEPIWRIRSWRGHEDFHAPGTWHLLRKFQPDIIHCHNLHDSGLGKGYFDLRAMPWLSQWCPIVLSLHDAWLLSGHCAHSFECDRWRTGCGQCPDLTIPPPIPRDATAYNWQRKQRIYAKSRLYVATPCNWLQRRVEQSILAAGVVQSRIIPYGIDLRFFNPTENKHGVRESLKLPPDVRVILCTGNYIRTSRWKDYQTMQLAMSQAAARLPEQKLLLVVLGLEDSPPEHSGNLEVRFMPYQQEQTVVQYYQAADIYLHAAKADTFPLSVLEALACGTPVIATETGGIPEQVEHERTGFLVAPGDAQRMAGYIVELLSNSDRLKHMGLEAVNSARRRFDLNRMINDYLMWYREILQGRDTLQ